MLLRKDPIGLSILVLIISTIKTNVTKSLFTMNQIKPIFHSIFNQKNLELPTLKQQKLS